jgi:hypothetical protein
MGVSGNGFVDTLIPLLLNRLKQSLLLTLPYIPLLV